MRTKIIDYRGWGIMFDTDDETFYASIEDKYTQKQSFASAKKYVDDYLKDNATFDPFLVERKPSLQNPKSKPIKIIGVRKDHRFIYEDEYGDRQQLPEYYEKDYILINPANNVFKDKLADLSAQIQELRRRGEATEKGLVTVTLKEVKAQYVH